MCANGGGLLCATAGGRDGALPAGAGGSLPATARGSSTLCLHEAVCRGGPGDAPLGAGEGAGRGGGRALPAAACAGGARHTHGHGEFRRSPAQGLTSMPVSLLAAFSREAASSRVRLCLALPHTSGLYLRRTLCNECLPSCRGRIILPSLASLVGGASAASGVSPSLRPCSPAE